MWLTLPFFGAGYLWCLYWVISIWQDGIEEEDMVRMTERLKSLEQELTKVKEMGENKEDTKSSAVSPAQVNVLV